MIWLRRKKWWWMAGMASAAIVLATFSLRTEQAPAKAASEPAASSALRVETIRPATGGIVRTTAQPGSAHSFESVGMFSKVSGFLKTQAVDIGSRVKRGDLLAEIDVPELVQELERDKALLRQAEAEVVQAESHVTSVIAERKAAEAYIVQAGANVKRSTSEREFKDKQYRRIRDLHALNSIEESLVDEKLDQFQAAQAGELGAISAVRTAEEQAAAAAARVSRAEADLLVARAKVQVAQAELAKTSVLLSYTRITSPCDGIITQRNYHPGAFIRAADQGDHLPLLQVDRTDLMRIVVQVPDRDVPFAQPGDPSVVLFDALPTGKFTGKVARVSASENVASRTMRVEIDVPNSQGIIRDGMYGHVEIELEEASAGVTIPSSCLAGDVGTEEGTVFVVDDKKVRLVEVKLGKDTGSRIEIVSGLTTDDEVVLKPPRTLVEGMAVDPMAARSEVKAGH